MLPFSSGGGIGQGHRRRSEHLAQEGPPCTNPFTRQPLLPETSDFSAFLEPEVLLSGCGVNFLFWPGDFAREFLSEFLSEFFGLVFPGSQAPPEDSRPNFTSRIVGIPLPSHFLQPNFCFFMSIFCLLGRSTFRARRLRRDLCRGRAGSQFLRAATAHGLFQNKPFGPSQKYNIFALFGGKRMI